jgi:hypothetical protein
MRNKVLVSVSVMAILALLLATGASVAQASENITYLGSSFISGKGLVIWFGLPNGYDPSGIEGSVLIDGVSYPLECNQHENGSLVCVAPVTKHVVGSLAIASIDGLWFEFLVKVPRPPVVFTGPWCYSIFDYGSDGDADVPPWGPVGVHCQSSPASVGDKIQFQNPNYLGTDDYRFDEDNSHATCGQGGGSPDFGEGYYYDCSTTQIDPPALGQ